MLDNFLRPIRPAPPPTMSCKRTFAINLFAPVALAQTLLPLLRKAPGARISLQADDHMATLILEDDTGPVEMLVFAQI